MWGSGEGSLVEVVALERPFLKIQQQYSCLPHGRHQEGPEEVLRPGTGGTERAGAGEWRGTPDLDKQGLGYGRNMGGNGL